MLFKLNVNYYTLSIGIMQSVLCYLLLIFYIFMYIFCTHKLGNSTFLCIYITSLLKPTPINTCRQFAFLLKKMLLLDCARDLMVVHCLLHHRKDENNMSWRPPQSRGARSQSPRARKRRIKTWMNSKKRWTW